MKRRLAAFAATTVVLLLAISEGCSDDTTDLEPSYDGGTSDAATGSSDAGTTTNPGDDVDANSPDADAAVDAGCLVVRSGCGSTVGVTITRYSNRAAFLAALSAYCPRNVNFDDVDTSADASVAIASDRYASLGLFLNGGDAGLQYVGRGFSFPNDFIPTSAPNSFAPGPQVPLASPAGSGGRDTDVTFRSGAATACVAGFGAMYIDADYPAYAASSLAVFSPSGVLDTITPVTSASGAGVFAGMIATDGTGKPVPVISRAHIVNGQGYPEVSANEGVTIDDMVFDAPAAP